MATLGHQLTPGSPQYQQYMNYAEQYGQSKGVPPGVTGALMNQESHVAPDAQSGPGAIGLMQVMPGKNNPLGLSSQQLQDPYANIRAGVDTLVNYKNQVPNGTWKQALEAYNWGIGNVDSGKTPPSSVQNYANSILNNASKYSNYGGGTPVQGGSSYGSSPLTDMSASNPSTFWYKNTDGTLEPGLGAPPSGATPISYDPNDLPIYSGGTGSKTDGYSAIGFTYDHGNWVPIYGDGSLGVYSPTVSHGQPYQPASTNYGYGSTPRLIPTSLTSNGNGSLLNGLLNTPTYDPSTGTYLTNPLNGSGNNPANPFQASLFGNGVNPAASMFGGSPNSGMPVIQFPGLNNPGSSYGSYGSNGSNASPLGGLFGNLFGGNTSTPSPGSGYGSNPMPVIQFPGLNNSGGSYGSYGSNGSNASPLGGLFGNLFGGNTGTPSPGSSYGSNPLPVIQFPGLNNSGGSYGSYGSNGSTTGPLGNLFGGSDPFGNLFGGSTGTTPSTGSNSLPTIQFPGLNNSGGSYGSYGSNGSTTDPLANLFGGSDPFGNLFGGSTGTTPGTNTGNNSLPTIQFPGLNNSGGSYGSYGSNGSTTDPLGNLFGGNDPFGNLFGGSTGTIPSTGSNSLPTIQFPGLNNTGGSYGSNGSSGTTDPLGNLFGGSDPFGNLFGGGTGTTPNTGNSSLPTIQFPGLNNSGGSYGTNNSNGATDPLGNLFGGSDPFGNLFGGSGWTPSTNTGSSSMPTIQFPGLNNSGNSYGSNGSTSDPLANLFGGSDPFGNLFGGSTGTTPVPNTGSSSMPTIQFPGLNNSGGSYGSSPSNGSTTDPLGNLFGGTDPFGNLFGGSTGTTPSTNTGSSSMPTIQFPGLTNSGGSNGTTTDPFANLFGGTDPFGNLFGGSTGTAPSTNTGSSSMPTIQFPSLTNSGGSYGSNPSSGTTTDPLGNLFGGSDPFGNLFSGSGWTPSTNTGSTSMPTIQFPGLTNSGGSNGSTTDPTANLFGGSDPFGSLFGGSGSTPSTNTGSTSMPTIQFPGLGGSTPIDTSQSTPIGGTGAPTDTSQSMPTIQFPGLDPTQSGAMDPTQSGAVAPTQSGAMDPAQSGAMNPSQSMPPADYAGMGGMGAMGGMAGGYIGPAPAIPSQWQLTHAQLDFVLQGAGGSDIGHAQVIPNHGDYLAGVVTPHPVTSSMHHLAR